MDSYEVLHTLPNAIYTAYTYYQIYVNVGGTLVYKGNTLAGPTGGPIILNLAVDSDSDTTGSAGILLLGKKKPEATVIGPPGQNGLNSDGTWSIKG